MILKKFIIDHAGYISLNKFFKMVLNYLFYIYIFYIKLINNQLLNINKIILI